MPKPLVARIQADLKQVMNMPDVRERMVKLGVDVVASQPEEFDRFMRSELVKWGGVAKQAGVKAN
jgi:tripartite-type tricarboxylate transporter receptor subunit TctC